MALWKDKLGIGASLVCAVHCAATPILIMFLPTLNFTEWMASPLFHQMTAVLCASLVGLSIIPSFRQTRNFQILGLATAGLSLIVAAAFVLPDTCCSVERNNHEHVHVGGVTHSHHDHSDHDHSDHTEHLSHLADNHVHLISTSSRIASKSESHDHGSDVATSSDKDPVGELALAGMQPWMTPIGGVLLILAHSMNLLIRHRSRAPSRCGCNAC